MKKAVAYFHTHRKAVIAWAGVLVTLLLVAIPHNSPWYAVLTAAAAAVGVHTVGNKPPEKPAP